MVGPVSLAEPTEQKKTEKIGRGTSGQVERRVRVNCVHEVERPFHRETHEPTRCHHFPSSGFRSRAPLILLRILSTRKSIGTSGTIYCSMALESRTRPWARRTQRDSKPSFDPSADRKVAAERHDT